MSGPWLNLMTGLAQGCAAGLLLTALGRGVSGDHPFALLFLALGIGAVCVANALHRMDR